MAGEKKKIKAELKAYPLKEMGKDARDFITASPVLTKKFQPILHSQDAELDPRKWTKKSLSDGLLAVARYEMKILAVRVGKAAKDAAKASDKTKIEKQLAKDYDEIKKTVLDKVSLAIDEVIADKGDNKKSLKDCKTAFDKLKKVDFDIMYQAPRQEAEKTFKRLAKLMDGDKASEAEKKKEVSEALKTLDICVKQFNDSGNEASDAIDTLLKAAKTTKNDKNVDAELKSFAESVLKKEGKISSVLAKSKRFSDALEAAQKILKSGDISAQVAKVQLGVFTKLAGLDGSAKDTLREASTLEPAFKKIEKKLK
jgi:hypothetical protein